MAPPLRSRQNSSPVISLFLESCRGDAKPGKTRSCHTKLAASGRSAERSDLFPTFRIKCFARKKKWTGGRKRSGIPAAIGKNELRRKTAELYLQLHKILLAPSLWRNPDFFYDSLQKQRRGLRSLHFA